jgi:hypothetical protein
VVDSDIIVWTVIIVAVLLTYVGEGHLLLDSGQYAVAHVAAQAHAVCPVMVIVIVVIVAVLEGAGHGDQRGHQVRQVLARPARPYMTAQTGVPEGPHLLLDPYLVELALIQPQPLTTWASDFPINISRCCCNHEAAAAVFVVCVHFMRVRLLRLFLPLLLSFVVDQLLSP